MKSNRCASPNGFPDQPEQLITVEFRMKNTVSSNYYEVAYGLLSVLLSEEGELRGQSGESGICVKTFPVSNGSYSHTPHRSRPAAVQTAWFANRPTHRANFTMTDLNFRDPEFVADPYPALAKLRSAGKPIWHEGLGIWLAARYADANAVLRSQVFGSNLQAACAER